MNKKEHLNKKGILKIISIRASMNKGLLEGIKKAFTNIIPIKRPINIPYIIKDPW